METFMIIVLMTLPNVQCTVTEGLLGLYDDLAALTPEIVNSSSFDRNAELRAAGLSNDLTIQQCLFKKTEEEGITTLNSVCNKFFEKDNVHNAFVDSINRHLVYIDCAINLPDISTLNTKTTNSTCHCTTLQEHPNKVGNKYNILTTSYNPGCVDEQINLSKYLFHSQEHLAVVALANIPDLLIQPGTFDNLELLDFVSLADNGLDSEDLPPGLFCNNFKLRKLHLQGLQFTTFPSHLFDCSKTSAEMQCLPQLSDVIIQHTSIEVIPPSPFRCIRGISQLLLTNNHIEDISNLCTENLNSVRVIQLQHNNISSLKPYMFQHLTNLSYLQLGSNKFTRLEAVWFAKASSLEFLMLKNNQISSIDGGFASLCLVGIHLDHNLLQSIPDNVFNNSDCLQTLEISSNQLVTFATGSLSGPDNIYFLNVSANNITSMTTVANAFIERGKYLKYLLIHDNGITDLKEFDFLPFINVKYLVLNNNYIEKIHPLAFANLRKLDSLFLENNMISHIGSSFSALSNLDSLYLGGNFLRGMNAEMFHGLHKLRILQIGFNMMEAINDDVIPEFNLMESTDDNVFPDFNLMESMDDNVIPDSNLTESMDDNVIIPASVEVLKVTFNLWKMIPCLSYRNNLSTMYLDLNRISYIAEQPWCFRENLLYLDLKFNSIEKIELGAFLAYSKLRTLILISNSLKLNFTLNYFKGAPLLNLNLDDNRIDSLENLFLHMPMYNLQSLVLDFNPITRVPKQPTLSATNAPLIVYIRSLSLANCNITSIHPQAFANFVNLENIDLSGNQITYFQNLQLHHDKLLVIDMQDNNIECTSRMKWLRTNESLWHLYNFKNYPLNGSQVVFDNLPVVFNQLPADLFVCKTDAECDTRMCICYAKNLNSEPSIVDCSDRDSSSLPKLFAKRAKTIFLHNNNYKYLSLSQNSSTAYRAKILTLHHCNIEQIAASSFTKFTYLEELYLNDNKIIFLLNDIIAGLTLLKILTLNGNFLVEISRELLLSNRALQVLYLHSNSLRELTTQARQTIGDLYNLTMLSLYDNPWICQCDNSSWKRWLSDLQPTLKNFQDIKCDNGASVLRTPDKFFLCPNDTVVQPISVIQNVQDYALAACLSVVLPLTVIIVMALSFYHRHLLAVFMFSYLGVRFHKDTSTGHFNYDAILLYDEEPQNEQEHSSNDTVIDFIHTWMTSVDPPYKVMLPIVDIDGGTSWAEEIARGISNSKMSVLYITMEFLEKQQTMNVFSIAYSTSMERQSIDLILIIDGKHTLEYLRSSHFEDPRLKALLRANKCILYHDKHFFKKLMYLLPGKKRSLNSTPTEEYLLEEL